MRRDRKFKRTERRILSILTISPRTRGEVIDLVGGNAAYTLDLLRKLAGDGWITYGAQENADVSLASGFAESNLQYRVRSMAFDLSREWELDSHGRIWGTDPNNTDGRSGCPVTFGEPLVTEGILRRALSYFRTEKAKLFTLGDERAILALYDQRQAGLKAGQ